MHVFSHVFTCTQGCFGSDVDPAYKEDITAFSDRFVELQEFTREVLDVGELTDVENTLVGLPLEGVAEKV